MMGVSGSGKTLIGSEFAREIGVAFVDGDDFHPPDNVKRMAAGVPLTDADRAGWLRALARRISEADRNGEGLVVACSALKRSYRDVLRDAAPDVRFVVLDGPAALIAERLATRRGHYMPASLLQSQLATLEMPGPDEEAWVADIARSPREIVADLKSRASR